MGYAANSPHRGLPGHRAAPHADRHPLVRFGERVPDGIRHVRTQPRGMATVPRLVSREVWPPVVTVIAPTLAAAVAVRPEATDGL